ncbi:MAG TPA: hypothetical protein VLF42_12000 [Burkholderiales bacterium]|nr:hypothetical protein [Burkholderiales bacterium]
MTYDYSDIERLQARARRERSEAVYRLIAAFFRSAFTSRPTGHAPRPHLARQG